VYYSVVHILCADRHWIAARSNGFFERTVCSVDWSWDILFSHETIMHFSQLGLAEPLLRAVAKQGYETPTPIQAQTIPSLLEGRDLLGCAPTGTGKTAAFALPILHRLAKGDRPAHSTRRI